MKMNVNNDAMGNRISKTVTNKNETNGDKFVTTYYVRDPQGNVLAVYEHKRGESGNGTFTLTEQHLYGASRLGMKKRDLALNVADASESTPPATHYELTNHLGNVMAVISDEASTTDEPAVVSLSDYYPYGMTEPGRSWNSGDYRFGYTGHEKENYSNVDGNNINVKEEQGGALTDMDNHVVVISPNVSGVYVDLEDKIGGREYVEQNSASVLFHEIGEILLPQKKTHRAPVVDYENYARAAIGLPKRPYDLTHGRISNTTQKTYNPVKTEKEQSETKKEEIETKNEESKTKNED